MFTGIIENVGKVVSLSPAESLLELVVDVGEVVEGVRLGDSVAVNGACLTVTGIDEERLSFEAVRETLDKTSLAELTIGAPVNLERAMRADGRLDGHIVQGHVDTSGRVASLEREGADVRLSVECGEAFSGNLVAKGSVAIEGVSLTVVDVESDRFDVVLIPHTLEQTTLGNKVPGDRVNLEADVLGKYVKKQLERMGLGGGTTPR